MIQYSLCSLWQKLKTSHNKPSFLWGKVWNGEYEKVEVDNEYDMVICEISFWTDGGYQQVLLQTIFSSMHCGLFTIIAASFGNYSWYRNRNRIGEKTSQNFFGSMNGFSDESFTRLLFCIYGTTFYLPNYYYPFCSRCVHLDVKTSIYTISRR